MSGTSRPACVMRLDFSSTGTTHMVVGGDSILHVLGSRTHPYAAFVTHLYVEFVTTRMT